MDTMLHPGPFAAAERNGGHVVVDGHGVVVARIEGEWPHRTAAAIAQALNEHQGLVERVEAAEEEANDLLEDEYLGAALDAAGL